MKDKVKQKRKPISTKTRFEVFKRDSFKCQYCGRTAPDVLLHVDHVTPFCEGGTDDLLNYVTSCSDCNFGKGKIKLSDDTELKKQRKQLEELNERRLQLKMMIEWREELNLLEEDKIDYVINKFNDLCSCSVTETGRKVVKRWFKKYSFEEIIDALDTSFDQYCKLNKTGEIEDESKQKIFDYIPKICRGKRYLNSNPELKEMYYINAILKNRFYITKPWESRKLIEEVLLTKFDPEELKRISQDAKTYTEWKGIMGKILEGKSDEIKEY